MRLPRLRFCWPSAFAARTCRRLLAHPPERLARLCDHGAYEILGQRAVRVEVSRELVEPVNRLIRGEHAGRSEEHTSELQSRQYLVCRLLLEKKQILLFHNKLT